MGAKKPGSKRGRRTVVQFVLSAVFVGITYWLVDINAVWGAIRELPLWIWFGVVLLNAALHVIQSMKWRIFLGISGVHVPIRATVRAHAAGQFGGVVLPSVVGGDAVRTALIAREFGKTEAVLFAGVVDRIVDTAALLTLVGIGFVLAPAALPDDTVVVHSYVFIATAVGGVLALVALRLFYRPKIIRRLPRRIALSFLRGRRAFRTMRRHPRQAAFAIILGLVLQAAFVVVIIIIGESLGLGLDTRLWFLLWPLAKIAAMLPASFGGIGVLELTFGFLVTGVADRDIAIATSVVTHTLRIAVALAGGGYWLLWGFESRGRAEEPAPAPRQ